MGGGVIERTGEGGGVEHRGLTDRYGTCLARRISIGREIDKGDEQTTDDRAPWSGREKLGGEVTMEWVYLMRTG